MADGRSQLELTDAQADAYDMLAEYFGTDALERLSARAVSRIGLDGGVGWKTPLPADYTGTERELWLLLPSSFPYEPPMARVQPHAYQAWPHALRRGGLCLWRDGEEPVGLAPGDQVRDALAQIGEVVKPVYAPTDTASLQAAFDAEWLAYWHQGADVGRTSAAQGLLLDISDQVLGAIRATCVAASENRSFVLLGGDEDRADNWIDALGGDVRHVVKTSALVVPLARPPRGAPTTSEELEYFLVQHCPEAMPKLRSLLISVDGPVFLVLRVDGTVPTFAALQITRILDGRPLGRTRSPADRRHQEHSRAVVGWRVATMPVERADPSWIHGRGFDMEAQQLLTKHVLLIGAGTLGGHMARALAAAGVGRLTLIDNEHLEVPNLGRHTLSARALNRSKAEALAEEIHQHFPHIRINAFRRSYHAFKHATDADAPDLVISTTADWPVEHQLMSQFAANEVPAIQVAWTEPHAVAGHTLISNAPRIGLSSLFDEKGQFLRAALKPAPPLPLAGCDGSHTPGTYARVQRIASLAAEQTIAFLLGSLTEPEHRMWIGDSQTLARLGVELVDSIDRPSGVFDWTERLSIPEQS